MNSIIYKNCIAIIILFICTGFSEESGLKKIAILMSKNVEFEDTYSGFAEEVEDEFIVSKIYLSDDVDALIKKLEDMNPDGIVLMENKSIKLAKIFQKKSTILKDKPLFPLMALRVDLAINGLKNVAAIKFEIPAYTIFSNLKYISNNKFKHVFVVYRKSFKELIATSKTMLAKENLILNAYCIDCDSDDLDPIEMMTRSVKFYEQAKSEGKIDIAWMLADNVFLKATLKGFWLQKIVGNNIAYVAPIDKFVEKDVFGGMIAFNPDYKNLGSQLADKVREVFEDNDGIIEENSVEELISVFSVLNKKRADKIGWKLKSKNLTRLQKIFE